LPTQAGQNYLVSLWLSSPDGQTPNEFSVNWNGGKIFDQLNVGNVGWTNLNFIVTATSSSTLLQFGFQDNPSYLGLDDVSVTPVSKPIFQATVKTANSFKLTWGTTTGLTYQVQYKTNLAQADWLDLGNAIVATNNTWTVFDTNSISASPQRFYRLVVSP
jgi:hypothetical protein